MSMNRRTLSGLLVTLLALMALSPMAVQAQPTEASEFYYGVEYDWTSLDSDLQNVTGLDINEMLMEIMNDADAAGFNLDIGQLTTGSSNVYVHQTEDITPQTIQDLDGNDVTVWSRTSDVVLRHGLLFNGILLTDWSETTFGSDPTSFDINVQSEFENVLTVDILYTEYLNDAYKLVGADMDIDMSVSADMSVGVDIALEGGGEDLEVDFDMGVNFGYGMQSTDAVWRLGEPSPFYIEASANDRTSMSCVEDGEDTGTEDDWGTAYVYDDCGAISGTYTGEADYEVFLTGIPTEEFGFDAGEFDLSVSDIFAQSGSYDEDDLSGEDVITVSMDGAMDGDSYEVDLGDGQTIEASACTDCPPGNPVMFTMMAGVLGLSSVAFGEAIGDDLATSFEDSLVDTIWGSMFADEAEDDYDEYDHNSNMWMCDTGEYIPEWYVNDGGEDCPDGSDEMEVYANYGTYEDWETEEEVHTLSGQVDVDSLTFTDRMFTCDDGATVMWGTVANYNDDCADGSDEDSDGTKMFTCDDGASIPWLDLNDYSVDCADGSDERTTNEIYTLAASLYDGNGNVIAQPATQSICDGTAWGTCDLSTDHGNYNMDLDAAPTLSFGENEMCTVASVSDASAVEIMAQSMMCDGMWVGPELSYFNTNSEGMSLNAEVSVSHWDSADAESDVGIHLAWIDSNDNVIHEVTTPLNDEDYSTYVEETYDVSNEGEYCVIVSLIAPGASEGYDSKENCEEVSEEGEPSERLMTIAEALADSSLTNVLEAFGENLATTFDDIAENQETPEFPYTDGMWAPLWSNDHATIVGVGVYAGDDSDNLYVIAGPETTGYSDDLPMTFISLRYLTGVPAQEAQTEMADFQDLDDIVDVENHDLAELAEILEEAGVDTSELDSITPEDDSDGNTDDTEQTAEDIAEGAGLLPFLSPLTVLAMIGCAALAGNRRHGDNA